MGVEALFYVGFLVNYMEMMGFSGFHGILVNYMEIMRF